MDYSEYKFADYSRSKEDEKMHSLELNVLRSSRVLKSDDEIVVVQMSNLDGSTNEDEIGADENYNLRTKRLKETTKLLRSISNPGQTSLPFMATGRCTYYDMEPRNRQFVSRLVVVVTAFIIFVLTIMIVFYILTDHRKYR